MACIFCDGIQQQDMLATFDDFFAVFDIDPIQEGHILLIAKAHITDMRDLTHTQLLQLMHIQCAIISMLEQQFGVRGVTTFQSHGTACDDGTHFHTHIIPRYAGDEFWAN